MAKTEFDNNERYPWNGENHKEQGYKKPKLTMEQLSTPEKINNKTNIEITNSGIVRQDSVVSTNIKEGMVISASSSSKKATKGRSTDSEVVRN